MSNQHIRKMENSDAKLKEVFQQFYNVHTAYVAAELHDQHPEHPIEAVAFIAHEHASVSFALRGFMELVSFFDSVDTLAGNLSEDERASLSTPNGLHVKEYARLSQEQVSLLNALTAITVQTVPAFEGLEEYADASPNHVATVAVIARQHISAMFAEMQGLATANRN